MARNAFCDRCKRAKNARGVTLVELIVVLVIMAILAGAGIGTSIGFVKRSEFNQNESNAETIYQTVQTALLQMDKSGSIDSFVKDNILKYATAYEWTAGNPSSNLLLEQKFNLSNFNSLKADTAKPNQSVHMRYLLTHESNPQATDTEPQHKAKQREILKSLIQPYFYDATIFVGTITIEVDV